MSVLHSIILSTASAKAVSAHHNGKNDFLTMSSAGVEGGASQFVQMSDDKDVVPHEAVQSVHYQPDKHLKTCNQALHQNYINTTDGSCSSCIPFPDKNNKLVWYPFQQIYNETKQFIINSMPSDDIKNGMALDSEPCCSGSSILDVNVHLSMRAKCLNQFTMHVPRNVWQNNVVPYAFVNEPRTSWRQLFWKELKGLARDDNNIKKVMEKVVKFNDEKGPVWKRCDKHGENCKSIIFKPNQTPAIMDPMSTRSIGYASCTGVSIYLAAAFRTIGIPARVVGTPAWNGKHENGNHNWVELYLPGTNTLNKKDPWVFIPVREGSPGFNTSTAEWRPDSWFCKAEKFPKTAESQTTVFASSWKNSDEVVELPWAPDYKSVHGVQRTSEYQTYCDDAHQTVTVEGKVAPSSLHQSWEVNTGISMINDLSRIFLCIGFVCLAWGVYFLYRKKCMFLKGYFQIY